MAAVASIVIQVDEKGAIQAFKMLDSEVEKLGPSFRKAGSAGNVVMTELAKQHRQANDAAQLLGRTLGVQLPRELNKFLAQSKVVSPVLASLFNVSLIGGFAMALTQLPK